MARYYLETKIEDINENAIRIFVIADGKVINSQIRETGTLDDVVLKRYKKDKEGNAYITGAELKKILQKQNNHAIHYARESAIRSRMTVSYY